MTDDAGGCLQAMRDLYDVSRLCGTVSYIWGGVSADISRGAFTRPHHDVDAFTARLVDVREPMARAFEERGYTVTWTGEFQNLKAERAGGAYVCLNPVDVRHDIAIWRHVGDAGAIYFPCRLA